MNISRSSGVAKRLNILNFERYFGFSNQSYGNREEAKSDDEQGTM
ncbi:hypothetical protein ACP70R_042139 [Stipagrostis hirtigluma subsp. patula]